MTRREGLAAAASVLLAVVFKAVEFVALPVRYRPDLMVVLAVSLGWTCGLWTALPMGFALGLIEDLVSGRAPGSRAISLSAASAVASLLRRFVNPDSILSRTVAAVVSAAVADVVCFGVLRFMGVRIGHRYFLRMILPASTAWSPLLILPVDRLQRWLSSLLSRVWPSREDMERGVTA